MVVNTKKKAESTTSQLQLPSAQIQVYVNTDNADASIKDTIKSCLNGDSGLSVVDDQATEADVIIYCSSRAWHDTQRSSRTRKKHPTNPERTIFLGCNNDQNDSIIHIALSGMAWAYVEVEREYGLKTRTVDLIRKAADKLMNGECYILRQIADDPELAREFLNNARYSKKKECPLSPDDLELLRLAANGVSNAKIASSKGFAEQTIKNRFSNILQVLDVKSRTEAVAVGFQSGWIR